MGNICILSKYETEIRDLYHLFIRYLEKDEDHECCKAAFDFKTYRIVFREEGSNRAHTIFFPMLKMECESNSLERMNILTLLRICNPTLVNIALEGSLEKQMNFLNYYIDKVEKPRYRGFQNVPPLLPPLLLLSKVNFFDKIEMKKLIDDTVRTFKDILSKNEISFSDVLYIYNEANEDQQIIDLNDQMIKRIINLIEYRTPKAEDVKKSISAQLKVDKELYKMGRKTIEEREIRFKSTAERVELKRGMDFVGGLIRYKVAIKNNTGMLIHNLEISLQMTAEHIRTIDIKPRVYKKGDRAKIPNMSPEQSESIDFYLEPMICGSIPVSPMTTYIDAFGKTQMVTRERLMVDSKCPSIINPGEENIAKVKNIYESSDIIRSFRSFELEHDPSKSFDLLKEAIGAWAGKHVSIPIYESQDPFIAEVYYYILNQNVDPDLGHNEQIIIKIRVDEAKNVAMLNIGAEKNPTVNGVLTHIWQLANARFGETYGYKFISLHCPECGGPLDNMDKTREIVKCKYCNIEFEKRAL